MRYLLICTHLGTILTFRYMFYIFSCCYNSRTIQYIKFKFEALLSYTKTTKCVEFQGVWCTGVRVGVFRISPIVLRDRFVRRCMITFPQAQFYSDLISHYVTIPLLCGISQQMHDKLLLGPVLFKALLA